MGLPRIAFGLSSSRTSPEALHDLLDVDLQTAINRFIAKTNHAPKPFVWTADPACVLVVVKHGKHALEPIH